MSILSELKRIGDWLKSEEEDFYSRETCTLVSGQNLKSGTVLGKITATGKFTAYDNGASDGSQAAVGVLAYDTDASGGDKTNVVYIAREAIVSKNGITWHANNQASDITAGIADLLALNGPILVRDGA